jgi:hypothetical protein
MSTRVKTVTIPICGNDSISMEFSSTHLVLRSITISKQNRQVQSVEIKIGNKHRELVLEDEAFEQL